MLPYANFPIEGLKAPGNLERKKRRASHPTYNICYTSNTLFQDSNQRYVYGTSNFLLSTKMTYRFENLLRHMKEVRNLHRIYSLPASSNFAYSAAFQFTIIDGEEREFISHSAL
jgi:hypothetical protein